MLPMSESWFPFLGALGLSSLGMLLMYPLAKKLGAISPVRADRWHTHLEVPRLAGPALLLAVLPWTDAKNAAVLAAFCAVGVLDDVKRLSAGVKILCLALPSALAFWATGSVWQAGMCFIVSTAMNLLDHADGLAGSVSLASLAVAGGPMGWAGAGACGGFLVHNFPPARAFMGDGGSHLLGVLAVLSWGHQGFAAVVLGSALPLADTLFVTLRRLREGRRPWIGGTDHSGHTLLRFGIHPRLMPLLYGGLAAACAWFGKHLDQ